MSILANRTYLAAGVALLVSAALLGIGLVTGFIRVDRYAGAYGVSVGTDTAYASIDLVRGHALVLSWERAS